MCQFRQQKTAGLWWSKSTTFWIEQKHWKAWQKIRQTDEKQKPTHIKYSHANFKIKLEHMIHAHTHLKYWNLVVKNGNHIRTKNLE